MGKKGTNGRRTSGITPAQVINELGMRGYKLVTDEQQNQPKTAYRKRVHEVQNRFRQLADGTVVTSITGDSVFMAKAGYDQVLLPVDGHMTDVALAAIERKTGVPVTQLKQKIARP